MSDFEIVAYDEAAHRPFLISTFLESMRGPPGWPHWPWCEVPPRSLEARLWKMQRAPDARTLVALVPIPDDPEPVAAGWVITRPQSNDIVAGYTTRAYRRKWAIGSSLAIAGGIDFAKPVGVWFWTYANQRLFRDHAGYHRLYHKVTDDEARREARKPAPRPARDAGPQARGEAQGHHAR